MARKKASYCEYDFSKIIDTKGGFIQPEEVEEEATTQIHNLNCHNCHSINVSIQYYNSFGLKCCFECIKELNYRLITQSEVLKRYLLVLSEFKDLKFMEKENPHNKHSKMKLYLVHQVEEICIKKYGSLDKLARVAEQKEDEKRSRNERKFKRKLKDLRQSTKVLLTYDHIHSFSIATDTKQICECGFEFEYEEL